MTNDQRISALIGQYAPAGRLGGGDIADTFLLKAQQGKFVLKTGKHLPRGIFASEAYSLSLLATAGVSVPRVVAAEDDYLLLEYLEAGEGDDAAAGRMLARLHAKKASQSGLDRNTFLASLLQNNALSDAWADFYFNQRLLPVLERLPEYNAGEQAKWEKFFGKVANLLAMVEPALLHGDLWAGNRYDAAQGPAFIDPACYYGDPLIDIAMTKLFGGFGVDFYRAYAELTPRRDAETELVQIYQLYPLLVHAQLFAGGYYASAVRLRDVFLR